VTDEHNPDGWTFSSLYKHVMALSEASKEAITAAMNAAKEAGDKADKATEKRFDSVNEFRNAMKDQQATFAAKDETNFRLTAIDKRLAEIDGKSKGANDMWGYVVGAVGLLIALGTLISVVIRGH